MKATSNKRLIAAGAVGLIFGIATLISGGSALFGNAATRAALGNIVPFVLWFNFIAGFLYFIAGTGLMLQRRWSAKLALLITTASAIVLIALGIHIARGGAYETRTLIAMSLRTLIWAAISTIAII